MRKTLQKSAALLMLSLLGPAAGWAHSVQFSADITSSDPSAWTAEGTSSGTAGAGDTGVKRIKAAAEATYPYTINFIESTDGWSAIDANGSGRTISKNSAYKYHVDGYDDTQAFPYMQDEYYDPANDYWVSPSFSFEAGKTYKAAFDVLQLYGANSYGGKVALELGKIGDDASSFKKIADLTLVGDDPQWGYTKGSTDPHTFQVAESGDYYVAAHVTGHDGAQTYVYLGFKGFSLNETTEASETTVDFNASTPDPGTPDPGQPGDVETKALPYNVDFSVEGSADAADWTIVDKSATAYSTWKYGSKYTAEGTVYGFKIDDDDYDSNDYLISPAFKLEAGKTYNIDLTNYAYTYGANLFIEYGTNKDDVTSFTQLVQTPRATVNGEKITGPYELTVPADGVYYIALRGVADPNAEFGSYYTYLVVSSFGLSEKNGGSDPDQPEKPDVEGTLPYSITFDSAEKFDEWSTIDNSDTKGITWTYTDSDFAGKKAAGFYQKDGDGAVDWLVSPKFQLKEGKTYTIKVDMASGDDNGAEMSLDYFQGTKDVNNFKSVTYLGNTLPIPDGDGVRDSWTLDVTKDGDYWFAFRLNGPWSWTDKQGTNVSIYSVSITENPDEGQEEEAVALPYSTDFSTEAGTTGWTAMDRSDNTGSTWEWREGAYWEYNADWQLVGEGHSGVAFSSDNGSNANDFWISPAFELTAGNTYKIKTLTTTNRTGYDSGTTAFTLKLGTNKKLQGSFDQTIGNIALNTVYDRAADEFEFSPKESGKYYVAYNIADEQGSNAYGYIFNFSIEEKVEPVAEIPYSITFDSADKFAEWSTIDHSDVPGVTWQYTASDFAGKAGATIGVDANSATCDFLVSPKFQLKGGKTYVFQADLKSTETNTVTLCLDYFKTVKDPESVNNVLWIGSSLPVEKEGQLTDSWTVDIPEDGNYWFALRALNWNPNGDSTDGISVYSVNITEEKDDPVALPYSTDFSTAAGHKGWKALDASTYKDMAWNFNSYGYQQFDGDTPVGDAHPCASYGPEWDSQCIANDYYTSPAFTLEAGKTYVVSTLTTASLPCIEEGNTKFTLKLGKERMMEASYDTTIGEIALNNVYDRDADTFEFTVAETGVYHVAYNAFNNVNSNSVYVYAFNFSLAEKEVVATAPVSELKAEELTDTKEVKLSWVNPTKDAKGNDLAADAVIDVNVYEGDKLLDTVDDAVPGALCDWTYAPETFEGTHTYKLVVVYDGVESEAATTELTIVVDGINGVIAVPAGAKVSVHTMDGALVGSDLQNLAKGTYIVTVKTADGTVKTVKVNK